MRRHGHRIVMLAALAVSAAGCDPELDPRSPEVGPSPGSGPPPAGLVVKLAAAGIVDGHVFAELEITEDDLPIDAATLAELRPAFTLAGLGVEPVSELPAWRSHLPLGRQLSARVPVAGPGTPEAHVLVDEQQPGAEEAQPEELAPGRFRHVFATVPPEGFTGGETLRVGVFMEGVSGNPNATSTLDFVAGGGTPEQREIVTDEGCAPCHGTMGGHGGTRIGVRICVSCHTYQLADPDTADPAAIPIAPATAVSPLLDPNPLEFGRLLHRIHRGRNLPTLYRAAASTVPAPAFPLAAAPPSPFFPGRNAVDPGRRFAVVSEHGHVRTFGEIRTRTDNGAAPRTAAAGIWYPRDYRECAVCHAGARDAPVALAEEISRRSCQGCHPDVWFGTEPVDAVHLAHAGGPQADDSRCEECHVRSESSPTWLAPLDDVHRAPIDRLGPSQPSIEILSLEDFQPGLFPKVVFRVRDRNGILRSLTAPNPLTDEGSEPSPVPRALWTTGPNSAVSILIGGPVAGRPLEYTFFELGGTIFPLSESVPAATPPDAEGRYTHVFTKALPPQAAGAWTAVISARRTAATLATRFDLVDQRFSWPYTGETVAETADQAVAHVDLAAGRWVAGDPTPANARRAVVDQERCEACHRRLAFHGGSRNSVVGCLVCHTPERTDWARRPKDVATGNVNLAATYDGLEEQSVHFKVMIHRIHTGTRPGTSATIERFDPYVIYGYGGNPYYFAEGTFPDDLASCDRCHADGTWRLDSLSEHAVGTVANETQTVVHEASADHGHDPVVLPMQATCTGCHANAFAVSHAERNTVDGRETCLSCHGARGSKASDKVHGLD